MRPCLLRKPLGSADRGMGCDSCLFCKSKVFSPHSTLTEVTTGCIKMNQKGSQDREIAHVLTHIFSVVVVIFQKVKVCNPKALVFKNVKAHSLSIPFSPQYIKIYILILKHSNLN